MTIHDDACSQPTGSEEVVVLAAAAAAAAAGSSDWKQLTLDQCVPWIGRFSFCCGVLVHWNEHVAWKKLVVRAGTLLTLNSLGYLQECTVLLCFRIVILNQNQNH